MIMFKPYGKERALVRIVHPPALADLEGIITSVHFAGTANVARFSVEVPKEKVNKRIKTKTVGYSLERFQFEVIGISREG